MDKKDPSSNAAAAKMGGGNSRMGKNKKNYEDVLSVEDEAVEVQGAGLGAGGGAGGAPGRRIRNRGGSYSSVPSNDHRDDHSEGDDDDEELIERRRRRSRDDGMRRMPFGGNGDGNNGGGGATGGFFFFLYLSVLGFLALVCVALLVYGRELRAQMNVTGGAAASGAGGGGGSGTAGISGGTASTTTTTTTTTSSTASSSSSPPSKSKANPPHKVRYDPTWTANDPAGKNAEGQWTDPYDGGAGGGPGEHLFVEVPSPPAAPATVDGESGKSDSDADSKGLGYLRQPHVSSGGMVFVAEGDLYYSRLPTSATSSKGKGGDVTAAEAASMPAMKLTTTDGNVRTPKLDPTGRYVAFTATYTAHRDVYLLDLRPDAASRRPAQRLTYGMDTHFGPLSVSGWKDNSTIVVGAYQDRVGLPDLRLFEVELERKRRESVSSRSDDATTAAAFSLGAGTTTPVPLAQAVDGLYNENGQCLYFVRMKQSSNTVRYVGGTAENLWMHCAGEARAVPLTPNYNGTSKSPSIATYGGSDYLLFLSDRRESSDEEEKEGGSPWTPSTMNLWAMPLPTASSSSSSVPTKMIRLTSSSCQFSGLAVQEYSVDNGGGSTGGDVVLRIGADLYRLGASEVEKMLKDGAEGNSKRQYPEPELLPVRVYSDFHEQQERLIPVDFFSHLNGADVFGTVFGTTELLATIRGQAWVFPVLEDPQDGQYGGIGQNIPPRRYRVAPGSTTGGTMRVLAARHVPFLNSDDDDDDDDSEDAGSNSTSTNTTAPHNPSKRLALILATDPLSATAEHAFYLVEVQSDATNAFAAREMAQTKPFLGGAGHGGSTTDGGLGSVVAESVSVSPCGRRMAWTDTDGRICVATLPIYETLSANATSGKKRRRLANSTGGPLKYLVLPENNEMGEPMVGSSSDLSWSPGGRYLAVGHPAKNQFNVISIVDCGNPNTGKIRLGRAVQATPSRFNANSPYWGKTSIDYYLHEKLVKALPDADEPAATTLYFLTDRDIASDVNSPWGTRAPLPHFVRGSMVYALPLKPRKKHEQEEIDNALMGRFAGGGTMEVFIDDVLALSDALKAAAAASEAAATKNSTEAAANATTDSVSDRRRAREEVVREVARNLRSRRLTALQAASVVRFLDDTPPDKGLPTPETPAGDGLSNITSNALIDDKDKDKDDDEEDALLLNDSDFPTDMDIDFGPKADLSFARRAYPLSRIPQGKYVSILAQTMDDGSLVLIDKPDDVKGYSFSVFSIDDFPGDAVDATPISLSGNLLADAGLSTSRKYMYLVYVPGGKTRIVPNTAVSLTKFALDAKGDGDANFVDSSDLAISVWPSLEYKQMYNDAWRLLRDYFYDRNMHALDWPSMHERYLPLVQRCAKREDLDDVLAQLAAELSALHVFVYGGEYSSPFGGDMKIAAIHEPASLGVTLERSPEWKGYRITEVPRIDPDFAVVNGKAVFCPLSDQTLRLSGQKGLQAGDVIVGINGESVLEAPDIFYLLRGMAGRSLRLEVLRLASGTDKKNHTAEEASTEPVITTAITPEQAHDLRYYAWEWRTRSKAKELSAKAGFSVGYIHLRAMDREGEQSFARDYFPDYDKQALILDVRHNVGGNIDSWILSFLQRKAWMYWKTRNRARNGDMDWDEQFAFRGHIVVLMDHHTGSDGEGVSRGIAELGLGRLIGTRTWGGGIWLSSDNDLVDGGIATAPEVGTFNEHYAFGLGYENLGVDPDIEVDNDPREAFDGKDTQLERAIEELKQWLQDEPVVIPNPPDFVKDVSINEDCSS